MRIDSVSKYTPYIINFSSSKNYTQNGVSFCGTNPMSFIPDSFIKNPWSKLRNFTIEEYKKLTAKEIKQLNEIVKKAQCEYINSDVRTHDLVASNIKATLDRKFGEGKYVIVAIGRSISSIGKCLGYKIGEENVKQIPMSNAFRFSKRKHLKTSKEDFELFNKYLNSIGLSKKEIEASGKTYIITDYCCTGSSLHGAAKLLRSDKVWGDKPNVISKNIIGLMDNKLFKFSDSLSLKSIMYTIFPKKYMFADQLEFLLAQKAFKKYSLVSKCINLSKTAESVIKPEQYSLEKKAFLFKLLDNEMAKSKLQ